MGTSNRFRVVTDVGYDDFMQWERPLAGWVSRESPRPLRRLAAPPRAAELANTGIQQRDLSPVTQVAKSYAKIPKSQMSGRQMFDPSPDALRGSMTGRGAARRDGEGSRATPRGLSHCIKSSYTTSVTTLKRLEMATKFFHPSGHFFTPPVSPVPRTACGGSE